MNEKVIYVGLDVDDQKFHGAALISATGEVIEFKCRPNIKGLINQLQILKAKLQDFDCKICYEATYIGFTLQRDLASQGYACEVIAPSSIPRVNGNLNRIMVSGEHKGFRVDLLIQGPEPAGEYFDERAKPALICPSPYRSSDVLLAEWSRS